RTPSPTAERPSGRWAATWRPSWRSPGGTGRGPAPVRSRAPVAWWGVMRVLLLGERAAVHGDDEPVTSVRRVSLVASLAGHAGVPQPRAAVAAALWPDTTPAQALTSLRRELHHLRRLLAGHGCLEVSSTHLTWRDGPGCSVDLLQLRAAAAALTALAEASSDRTGPWEEDVVRRGRELVSTYRGGLLPGVDDAWAVDLGER